MKTLFVILKLLTFPVWLPFWLLAKVWRVLAVLLLVGLIAGCTSASNKFDRSPCACEFQQLNSSEYGEKMDA